MERIKDLPLLLSFVEMNKPKEETQTSNIKKVYWVQDYQGYMRKNTGYKPISKTINYTLQKKDV